MRFYKSVNEQGIVSINTLNADGEGNITEAEYNTISGLLSEMPKGKVLHDDGDGYSYIDVPINEDDPTPEEILSILTGESE